MSLRSNYVIQDFLLFSDRVYDRMFELHNAALWPVHIPAAVIGLFLVFVVLKPSQRNVRIAFALLALVWLFVAYAFFYQRYATINWAAVYVAPLFALMALVLGGFAVRARPPTVAFQANVSGLIAAAVLLAALVGYPLLGVVTGKSWSGAQVFGVAADPTAMATLGFLAMCRGTGVRAAMIIPALWSVATALTLYALGSGAFAIAPFAAAACFVAHIMAGGRRHAADRSQHAP